jgi:hypothetical protein
VQFSLWDLLSLLTAAALLCGFSTWMQVPWTSLRDALAFAGLFGGLSAACLLIGARCARPSRMIPLMLLAMLLAGCVLGALGAERNYVIVLSVLCAYNVLALQALKIAGLRLGRIDGDSSGPTARVARPEALRRA